MNGKSITFIGIAIITFGKIFGQQVLYPTSAYSLGMGNSNFATYSLGSVYYNPASLAFNINNIFTICSGIQYFDLKSELTKYTWNRTDGQISLSYVSRMFGTSLIYKQHGDRKTLLPLDDPNSFPPVSDIERSKDLSHTYYLLLFYGRSISSTVSTGLIAKFLYNEPELITKRIMSRERRFSFAVDLGFKYKIMHKSSVSFLLQNILSFPWYYSIYDYYDEIEFKKLPVNINLAFSYYFSQKVTVVTEIGLEPLYFYKEVENYPRNDSFHFGLRYEINRIIRLLTGYQYQRTIKSFYEKPFGTRKVDGSFELVHEYVYHSLHGFTLGADIQINKINIILSLMTNDRRSYYEDKGMDVTGSTFYYSLSMGYLF